jgi:ATP-binding cassette, subfamily B, bacterial
LGRFRSKEILKLLSFIKPRTLQYFTGLLCCGLVDAAMSNIVAFMIKDAADAALKGEMKGILRVCALLSISVVVLALLTPLSNYLFSTTVKKVMAKIKLEIFSHVEGLRADYYENTHSGDTMSRLTNDIEVMENIYTGNIRSIVSMTFSGVYAAVFMLIWDWKLALLLFFMGTATAYLNSRFSAAVRRLSTKLQSSSAVLTEHLTDMIAGFYCLKMFHIEDNILGKYNEANRNVTDTSLERSKSYAVLSSTNFFILWVNNGGSLVLGTYFMLKGNYTLGTLLGMVLLLQNVTSLFRRLGNYAAELQSSLAGAARIIELLEVPAEPERYSLLKSSSKSSMIELQKLVFSYGKEKRILDKLSLKIEKGSIAALVGPSGSGKSTIIKLLMGFYPPESGSITIDGRPMGYYSLTELRDMIAYVSQDSYLFEGTIEENIRYGRLDASPEEIIAAAKLANAHEFIITQPDGYKTMVGERGARLSGGQKQRIAIARALLKNAPILLLDEATSALDSMSEKLVQQALDTLMKGRTTIIIAHRLSTIKNADMIFVIDRGNVIEQGSHNELITAESTYKRMYRLQFLAG